MRSLILADVHANLEALNAVLADANDRGGFDEIWCLGDTVGYGPDPNACLELLRGHHLVMVAGNHDFAAVNKLSISNFNPAAQASTHWTSAQLSRDGFDFLAALPLTAITGEFTLVHGSLKDPLTEYLLNVGAALDTFALMTTLAWSGGALPYPFHLRSHQRRRRVPGVYLRRSGAPGRYPVHHQPGRSRPAQGLGSQAELRDL